MKLVENEVRSIASRTEVWLIPRFIEIIIEPSKCMFRKEETRDLNRLSVTDRERVLSIASLPEQELLSINVFLLLNYLNYSLICVSFMDSLLYTLRIIGMVSDYEWLNFRQTLNTITLSIKVYKEYAALQGHSKSFRLNKEYLFALHFAKNKDNSTRFAKS
ncbi:hypothetical protein HZH66_014035 [Vespula vulgaris]|uniref:Uncharacterized protein n=1 Tax=Vespula vulgaris TaxID=7454 RepID=A0A834J5U1_VESVU|nr:hypothetical protein HZH66_014035 [Vespula vulgaris]